MPEHMGISHIDLTVSDCERAAVWWQDVMGFTLVNHFRGESWDVKSLIHPTGATVSVMTHDAPADGAFDERRVGLDHLAFRVADRDELERWVRHLDAHGVTHSGVIDIGFGATVVFRDPDNMQLEFYVHPGADEVRLNATDSAETQQVLVEAELATRQE
ncbi:MAG: VOC family protein [Mycobacterium sp.]|nr:VOC family protein [Mycobacterium sp.]